MIKSLSLTLVAAITTPNFFSILLSIVGVIYFLSMIKVNVVDKKYKGEWKLYFKAIFKFRK